MDLNETANFQVSLDIMASQYNLTQNSNIKPDQLLATEMDLTEDEILNELLNDSFQFEDTKVQDEIVANKDERFKTVSEEELRDTLNRHVPQNTKRNTAFACNTYNAWAEFRNKQPQTQQDPMGPVPLDFTKVNYPIIDYWMTRFVMEVRRKNKEQYPPNTLYNMVVAIQRFYKDVCERPDIDLLNVNNQWFIGFRKALDGRMKKLTEEGLNVVRGSDTVSPDDEQQLWDSGVLNTGTAKGLSNCVFLYNGKVFGLRGGAEHRNLMPSQFKFFHSADGEYVEFTSRNTKNVSGGLKSRNVLPRQIQHFAEPDNDRCIVSILRKYLSKIPESGPFYKKPLAGTEGQIAFSSQNIGEHTLRSYVKTMFAEANINTDGRKITNHSARRCQITTLYNAGVSDFDITQRSGHRSNAIDQYKLPDSDKKKMISKRLNPPSCTLSKAPSPKCTKVDHTQQLFTPSFLPETLKSAPKISPVRPIIKPEAAPAFIPPPGILPMPPTTFHSNAQSGQDVLKLEIPDTINKLIIYRGSRETVIILN